MSPSPDVVFLSGVRTGFGGFGGALKDLTATDLGAAAAASALERAGVPPATIDHLIIGNAMQTSADGAYLARHVGLRAGCPIETPAVTVNRLCGSGFEAIVQGAHRILLGEARVVLAGGAESMSQAPYVIRGTRWGTRLGSPPVLEDLLWQGLTDRQCGCAMGITAENLAARYGITREETDAYALRSQQGARAAWENGWFEAELCPVPVADRKTGKAVPWAADEHMRPETTLEALSRLPPVFKPGGVVTAGNASGISDGAGACVLASAAAAAELGATPIGRLVGWGVAGVDPTIMGIGPAPAIRQALARSGLTLAQMDRIEVNEAFAAQYLAVEKELGLDRARTNVEGGGVSLGHPLGASGARITVHLLHTLRRLGKRYGLGSACIGGGQGIAVIVEALP
jgi:acetyl-CoA acyltransferase 2